MLKLILNLGVPATFALECLKLHCSVRAGEKLGPYEILGKIGQGGMGEVYRARDITLKRDKALKVLPADFSNNPERMARFQREAEVLASLDHPNSATFTASSNPTVPVHWRWL